MAHKPTYKVKFRRRREGKTNYEKRLALVKNKNPRLVVRVLSKTIVSQIIKYAPTGDKTLVDANSLQVAKLGYKGNTANTPAAYLTGYLCGLKAKKQGVKQAVLDIGLSTPTKGSKVFAALKGAVDAGLNVPHSGEKLPTEERVKGQTIAEYGKNPGKFFQQYAKKGLSPSDLPKHVEQIKEALNKKFGGKKDD